jgi:hypothetical protein
MNEGRGERGAAVNERRAIFRTSANLRSLP